jgi:hypothetical protein
LLPFKFISKDGIARTLGKITRGNAPLRFLLDLKITAIHYFFFCSLVGAMVFKQVTTKSKCTHHNKKLQLIMTSSFGIEEVHKH